MHTSVRSYTTESVLATLGYPDPLVAARQHARMILLGRLARYQAAIRQLEVEWGCTLEDLRARYTAQGNASSQDWSAERYADAVETVNAQLTAISEV